MSKKKKLALLYAEKHVSSAGCDGTGDIIPISSAHFGVGVGPPALHKEGLPVLRCSPPLFLVWCPTVQTTLERNSRRGTVLLASRPSPAHGALSSSSLHLRTSRPLGIGAESQLSRAQPVHTARLRGETRRINFIVKVVLCGCSERRKRARAHRIITLWRERLSRTSLASTFSSAMRPALSNIRAGWVLYTNRPKHSTCCVSSNCLHLQAPEESKDV